MTANLQGSELITVIAEVVAALAATAALLLALSGFRHGRRNRVAEQARATAVWLDSIEHEEWGPNGELVRPRVVEVVVHNGNPTPLYDLQLFLHSGEHSSHHVWVAGVLPPEHEHRERFQVDRMPTHVADRAELWFNDTAGRRWCRDSWGRLCRDKPVLEEKLERF